MLKIDDKPQTKYHDGKIIEDTRNDLISLVDNKGAFDISNSYGPSKKNETSGCTASLYPGESEQKKPKNDSSANHGTRS